MAKRSDLVKTYGLDSASIEGLIQLAAKYAYDSILVTAAERLVDGRPIVFVNSAFTLMTGYREDEVIGRTAKMFQGPKTDRKVLAELEACIQEGRDFHGRAINYRKDRSEYLLEWRIFAIRNKEDQVTHYASIQRDVTSRLPEPIDPS